jgi:uncharacterized repeat protein (TIGR04138 family)
MPPPLVLEQIRALIIDAGRDTRYKAHAYLFVLSGMEYYMAQLGQKRHVSGQELSRGLAQFAHKQYGPLAWQVLSSWGITTTDDFGALVYNMIHVGMMSKMEQDRLEDFFGVFDLAEYFAGQDCFAVDKAHVRQVRQV